MSQRDDLLTQLREARPMAPAELREHVRRIAEEAAPAPRRATHVAARPRGRRAGRRCGRRRRDPLPGREQPAVPQPPPELAYAAAGPRRPRPSSQLQTPSRVAAAPRPTRQRSPPRPDRVQRITTSLELRLPNTQAVSDATKQAVAITRALGGYPKALNVDAEGRTGYASLVLRIPKQNVQRAVSRLSGLGTIVGENVQIQDIQAQVDATARKIAGCRHGSPTGRRQPQPRPRPQQHVAALTDADREAPPRPRHHDQDRELRDRLGADDDEARARPGPQGPRPAAQPRRRVPVDRDRRRLRARARRAASSCSGPRLARRACRPPAPRERAAQLDLSCLDLGEHPERRLPDRQLAELGVDAAGLVGARRVGLLDLGLAHRQRLAHRADRAEARPSAAPPPLSMSRSISTS